MLRITAAPSSIRFALAALFALLLALRLIGSAGYMPAVEHGSLTIIVCPDAELSAPLALGSTHQHHHQGGQGREDHGRCPFAVAGSLGALGLGRAPLLAGILFGAVLLAGPRLLSILRQSTRDRPPAIGPPIPA